MVLLIDIGNSRTAAAIYQDGTIQYRMDWFTEDFGAVSDRLQQYFLKRDLITDTLTGVAISSVVPIATIRMLKALRSLTDQEPFLVQPGINIGMILHYDSPEDIGSDRIANAVAAKQKFGVPVLIMDFGTATTMTLVNSDGSIAGGLILPGINLLRNVLGANTAQLMEVPFCQPNSLIGNSTVGNIQSGVYHLIRFGIEGILKHIREYTGGVLTVVATGGLCETASREIEHVDCVSPNLTLEGIYQLFTINRDPSLDSVIWPSQ